ncbi:MAG: DNA cytosine methyltransferase [Planctomycetes bacterium]|nr:DNA cytosine methyltransferase [Planctomycetota bacterium]
MSSRLAPTLAFVAGLLLDHFCGGGGASEGMAKALGKSPDVACNHDRHAIAMHQANHPATRHLCADIRSVDPVEVMGGRFVDLLWASPDCKHFSRAKGGTPVDQGIRDLAWNVIRWAAAGDIRCIMMENVPEFVTWCPVVPVLGRHGKHAVNRKGQPLWVPDKTRTGETFREFIGQLRALGYVVEWRTINAADFGVPTARHRWYLIARRDGQPITWPKITHGRGLLPYHTAAECIDFSLPTRSIFGRKKPLADASMARIREGIARYVVTGRAHIVHGTRGIYAAFIAKHNGGAVGQLVDGPLHTITAKDTKRLIVCFLVKYYGNGGQWQSVDEPLHTITSHDRFGLITVTIDGETYRIADVGQRMLTPRELATAQGFDVDYILTGTRSQQIARIGNSVCPPVAAALVASNLAPRPARVAA